MWTVHQISMALFAITAVLLIFAEFTSRRARKRYAVVMAMATVLAADWYLLHDVPELQWEKARPMRARQAGKPRQHGVVMQGQDFDPEDAEEAANEGGGGGSANSVIADIAESVTAALTGSAQPKSDPSRLPGASIQDCPECPEMVVVPAGNAHVGADAGDPDASEAELPRRTIPVWPGFAISRVEIRQSEFAAFMAANSAAEACRARAAAASPALGSYATCLTWDEATHYTAFLSRRTGKHYRLPSAIEWEYVARLDAEARHRVASADPSDVAPIARAPRGAEGFGGGVAEYTADCWRDLLVLAGETSKPFQPAQGCHTRVLKDGADGEVKRWQRAAARRPVGETTRSATIGLRVVRELD